MREIRYGREGGAALIVALIMLLVVALLAISSTREATLEARITGNVIGQQKRLNFAEAVLREGEIIMTLDTEGPDAACGSGDDYCLYAIDAEYGHEFGDCDAGVTTVGAESRLLDEDAYDASSPDVAPEIRWYAVRVNPGASQGQAENPEYGNMARNIGPSRYEITARARDLRTATCTVLRSTTARID